MASDITYIRTREGWLYLCTILDLWSRRVIGWAMRHTLEEALLVDAFTMALSWRKAPRGLVVHSDRGVQYAGRAFRRLFASHRIRRSMSRKGNCWDNAVSESFFATLKVELVDDTIYEIREEARAAIFEYIEIWYNRERLHSSLGYLSPEEFESAQAA